MHKKNKLQTIAMFVLLASYAVATGTCTLGDDIYTLRANARDGKTITVPGASLDSKLKWLEDYIDNDLRGPSLSVSADFMVEVNADESIGSYSFNKYNYSGTAVDITITLKSIGTRKTIRLSSIVISTGVTLVLDNITLQKRYDSSNYVISSNSSSQDKGGTLIMNEGSAIANGGVSVAENATFTMNGGKISGNTVSSTNSSSYGGGVYVGKNATFTMSGGEISGNTVSSTNSSSYGGGVYVGENATFTMSGGEISGNTVSYTGSSYYGGGYGGGVYVSSGTFTKTGGTITGYASDTVNGNVVRDSSVVNNRGHAVYINSSSRRRETTAGPDDNLDSTKSGTAGGWDN